MANATRASMTFATIKRCCEINPGVTRIEDVKWGRCPECWHDHYSGDSGPACPVCDCAHIFIGVRLACVYRPPVNPLTHRIDKRALRDAVAPELFYVWTAQVTDEQPWVINDPANVMALLEGESLESVKARVEAEHSAEDTWARIAANQPPLFSFTSKRER